MARILNRNNLSQGRRTGDGQSAKRYRTPFAPEDQRGQKRRRQAWEAELSGFHVQSQRGPAQGGRQGQPQAEGAGSGAECPEPQPEPDHGRTGRDAARLESVLKC